MAIELSAALQDLEPNAVLAYRVTGIDLEADTDNTISGSSFSPSLTKKPIGYLILDSTGEQLSLNPPTSELNSGVYDVTLSASEALINIQIIAICERL